MSDAARALPDDTIELGAQGELRLPDRLREALGWKEGEALRVRVAEDGSLRIDAVGEGIRKARGMLRARSGGTSLVDELIEQRRREADRE
jgi:bifunctional DNA-binding transcriptional regulator/antitoxin component of YhaV-PrlF toxin-antitoxin module